ncbi:MAG: catechol 2,3-dioxygenase-like lactoylglutathione lyase family enzyme [Candidatus Poriferisodalaceae bacterium]|jgi:catechol 2,3-dioxygenase-like lactoylglutathione lyase family enzyme
MPLGHLGLNVSDLDTARGRYARLMPELGFELFLDHDDEFAYRPAGGKPGTYLFFYPAETNAPFSPANSGLQHLAFIVRTRSDVVRVAALAEELGCTIVHPPQDWPQYPPPYHAAFWTDPDGFMIEVVCHNDRD